MRYAEVDDNKKVQEPIISKEQALQQNLIPLSEIVTASVQHWILLNMALDMKEAGIKYAFVKEGLGISIWRTPPKLYLDSHAGWVDFDKSKYHPTPE